MGRLNRRLLPKKELLLRVVTITHDQWNYPEEGENYMPLEVRSVQPVTGKEVNFLDDSIRDSKVYKIYTDMELKLPEEGSSTRYEIEVEPGSWYAIVKSQPWGIGVQSHTVLFVAEINER